MELSHASITLFRSSLALVCKQICHKEIEQGISNHPAQNHFTRSQQATRTKCSNKPKHLTRMELGYLWRLELIAPHIPQMYIWGGTISGSVEVNEKCHHSVSRRCGLSALKGRLHGWRIFHLIVIKALALHLLHSTQTQAASVSLMLDAAGCLKSKADESVRASCPSSETKHQTTEWDWSRALQSYSHWLQSLRTLTLSSFSPPCSGWLFFG